jgi:peptidoglycan biosynthesis protein MviN/MurJ (putative lipid II flippase)
MDGADALRCVLATLLTFAILAALLCLPGNELLIGAAALLAPLAGAAIGAWQARAAGATRPLAGLGLAGVLALALGLLVFAGNETTDETLNTWQPILVVVGALVGTAAYGVVWFGSTAAR